MPYEPGASFLDARENVARDEKWRSKGPAQLEDNETFAAEVADVCKAELVPFRPMLRKRLDNAFASAKLTPDAKLIETGMKWVTVRAIMVDWPKVRHRVFPPETSTVQP